LEAPQKFEEQHNSTTGLTTKTLEELATAVRDDQMEDVPRD
jgi:hypothetical protein